MTIKYDKNTLHWKYFGENNYNYYIYIYIYIYILK